MRHNPILLNTRIAASAHHMNLGGDLHARARIDGHGAAVVAVRDESVDDAVRRWFLVADALALVDDLLPVAHF